MVCRPLTPLRLTGALSPLVRLALEPADTLDCCREHVCQILFVTQLLWAARPRPCDKRRLAVDVIVERCAGLDVHKKTVMAAVRTPGTVGKRREVVREFSTYNEGPGRPAGLARGRRCHQGGDGGDRCQLAPGLGTCWKRRPA